MSDEDGAEIKLSSDEALVLFDFLARLNEARDRNYVASEAELQLLRDVEAMLESQLVAPFEKNYEDLVRQAQDRLVQRE